MDSDRTKKKRVLSSPRLKELKNKKKRDLRNKILFFIFLFLVFLFGLSFASRIKKININNIQISGNKVIDTKDIEESVKNTISGRYLGLFSKSNFLIYPRKKIEHNLALKFKRLKDISVNINDFQTITISVNEREGEYLWCGNTPPQNQGDTPDCYFLDDEGYFFDQAPYFSGEVFFKFYGLNNPASGDLLGTYFLPDYFNKIILLKENIEKMKLKPAFFYLENTDDADIYLSSNNTLTDKPKIIFKINSDYEKMIANLQTVVATDPLASNLKNKYNSLQYIDLRFGNKVYYKFK